MPTPGRVSAQQRPPARARRPKKRARLALEPDLALLADVAAAADSASPHEHLPPSNPGVGSLGPAAGLHRMHVNRLAAGRTRAVQSQNATRTSQPQSGLLQKSLKQQVRSRPAAFQAEVSAMEVALAPVMKSLKDLHAKVDRLQQSQNGLQQRMQFRESFMPLFSLAVEQPEQHCQQLVQQARWLTANHQTNK